MESWTPIRLCIEIQKVLVPTQIYTPFAVAIPSEKTEPDQIRCIKLPLDVAIQIVNRAGEVDKQVTGRHQLDRLRSSQLQRV